MLECKLDLATFLGETSRCVKKLEYMKIISQCGICSCYSVGFATLSHRTADFRARLNTWGYDKLKVFGYEDVSMLITIP